MILDVRVEDLGAGGRSAAIGARARARCAHGQRGAITWVGLALLGALVSSIYLGWIWGPIYVDHYVVKQLVQQLANQAVQNPDDALLVELLAQRIRSVRLVEEAGPDRRLTSRPAIDLKAQDVTWERLPPASLRVAFLYRREVVYPLIGLRSEALLSVDRTFDVSRPRWDDGR